MMPTNQVPQVPGLAIPQHSSHCTYGQVVVHTLLPEVIIADSQATVPGCTYSTAADAASSSIGHGLSQQSKGCQLDCSSWFATPRLRTITLALPSTCWSPRLNGSHSPHHHPSNIVSRSCVLPGSSNQEVIVSSADLAAAAGDAAKRCALAHIQQQPVEQKSNRSRTVLLSPPSSIPVPLQQQIEQLKAAQPVGRNSSNTQAGVFSSTVAKGVHSASLGSHAPLHSSSSSSGCRLMAPGSLNSTKATFRQRAGSPLVTTHAYADFAGGANVPQGCASLGSSNISSRGYQAMKGQRSIYPQGSIALNGDMSYVAADIAALLHIQLGQSGGVLNDLQHNGCSDGHIGHPNMQSMLPSQLQQPRVAGGATAARGLALPNRSASQHQLACNSVLYHPMRQPGSPRAVANPVLIDTPGPVGGQGGCVESGEAEGCCQACQVENAARACGQQCQRPPGGFIGFEPVKVCLAGNLPAAQGPIQGKSYSGVSCSPQRVSVAAADPHRTSITAQAAAAGAGQIGNLLQQVLLLEPKEYGSPSIALSPWRQSQAQGSFTGEQLQVHANSKMLSTWKQP